MLDIRRFICSMSLMCLMGHVSAKEVIFPDGCVAISAPARQVSLKSGAEGAPSLYLIHNRSPHELWLTHPVKNPSASAGWTSKIEAGRWSAISIAEPAFALSCVEVKPGSEQYVDCEEMVTACHYQGVKFADAARGGYWVAEDKSLKALLSAIPARGIILPKP